MPAGFRRARSPAARARWGRSKRGLVRTYWWSQLGQRWSMAGWPRTPAAALCRGGSASAALSGGEWAGKLHESDGKPFPVLVGVEEGRKGVLHGELQAPAPASPPRSSSSGQEPRLLIAPRRSS